MNDRVSVKVTRTALAIACLSALPAAAQTYPSKPVKFVVPFVEGGRAGSRRGGCGGGGDGARTPSW